uniref:NADH-quinone oxidoreductase subunit B n=1 Tax=Ascaris lumbricoides TaxID=6252 RepID=A0A0M3HJZ6_ASCLU
MPVTKKIDEEGLERVRSRRNLKVAMMSSMSVWHSGNRLQPEFFFNGV